MQVRNSLPRVSVVLQGVGTEHKGWDLVRRDKGLARYIWARGVARSARKDAPWFG